MDAAADNKDFGLSVEHTAGETVVTASLAHAAQDCYALFCDADSLPRWLWVVGRVVVQQRDDRGRALEVDFIGSLERASIAYTLRYEYHDAACEVRWHHAGRGVKELRGSAQFIARDESGCVLRYTLRSELASSLPPWADLLYRAQPAETVVIDFCEWADGRLSGRRKDATS